MSPLSRYLVKQGKRGGLPLLPKVTALALRNLDAAVEHILDAKMTTLLSNATLVTLNERSPVAKSQELLIEEGIISQIGGRVETNRTSVDMRIDCSGKIVIPGLINTHSHLLEILQRSFRDNVRKEVWLRKRQMTEESARLPDSDIGAAAALACGEMLKSGVTAVVDHFSLRAGITAGNMKDGAGCISTDRDSRNACSIPARPELPRPIKAGGRIAKRGKRKPTGTSGKTR